MSIEKIKFKPSKVGRLSLPKFLTRPKTASYNTDAKVDYEGRTEHDGSGIFGMHLGKGDLIHINVKRKQQIYNDISWLD